MRLYILALNRTDSLADGFLPAAERLGADVTLLTNLPEQYEGTAADTYRAGGTWQPGAVRRVVRCDVRSLSAVIGCIVELGLPDAIFTNSDHLQVQAALAATYFGLPAKDWSAAVRTKNKALMRRHLAAAGLDAVTTVEIGPDPDLDALAAAALPYPCVLKPREGVASEDVVLVHDSAELVRRVAEIQRRRPNEPFVAEELLDGPLHTLETLGSGQAVRVLGGFRTRLSSPPHFVELGLDWYPDLPDAVRDDVLRQLAALGVGLGACHTEFVRQGDRARLVEVNYRVIGDQCDLLLAELLDEPLFELVLRAHLGDDVTEPAPRPRRDRHARIDYVCAQASGIFRAAPEAQDRNDGKVILRYRPLRQLGSSVQHSNSNRDYLGVVRAIGEDQPSVDRAVEDFLAGHTWEVRP